MKTTGIVRKLDRLGRVVLPMELRETMHLESGDGMAISTDGESIILTPSRARCIFCGSVEDLTTRRGMLHCPTCVRVFAGGADDEQD